MTDAMFQTINRKLDQIELMLKAIIKDGWGLSNCVDFRIDSERAEQFREWYRANSSLPIQPSDADQQ